MNKTCICFLAVLSSVTCNSDSGERRIVGGTLVKNFSKYAFIVGLTNPDMSLVLCTGTLINPEWVLTAAHCVFMYNFTPPALVKQDELLICSGHVNVHDKSTDTRTIKRIVAHPKYNHINIMFGSDVALIQITTPFDNATVKIGKLATYTKYSILRREKSATAVGWGVNEHIVFPNLRTTDPSGLLSEVILPLIPHVKCIDILRRRFSDNNLVYIPLPTSTVCTMYGPGGRDICKGDSGGPLLVGDVQIGVTSWAFGCAQKNTPAVFTRVDFFRTWMYSVINASATFYNTVLLSLILSMLIIYIE